MTGWDSAGDALVDAFTDDQLKRLAHRLRPWIVECLRGTDAGHPDNDGWLDTKAAAQYLGISRNALHKLTAARTIPSHQDGPGCKHYFRATELDAWRKGGGAMS